MAPPHKAHGRSGNRSKVAARKAPTSHLDTEPNKPPLDTTVESTANLIAELSESILQDPSTAFSAQHEDDIKTPSKMSQLLDIAKGSDEYTSRLAIMSLLALFVDIVPSYRIRMPSAAEMAVRVSKETKKVWDYEKSLLSSYQQYLKLLERTWEQTRREVRPSPLSITAMLSLCELLKSAFHFNFSSNLLGVVVRSMNSKTPEVSDACCASVQHVFSKDAQGDTALEAARMVAKRIKDSHFKVRPTVLRTFLSLPLRVHVDEAQAAKLAAAAQAKKKKRNREEAEIEQEMKEGSSSVDKIILARSQSDTLQAVTLTYFRILKSEHAELLPPALEGLAKFSHLINFETVVDLLAVLKELLSKVDILPLDAALNCILTAFQTLQGPGREMKIDQKEYITPLYTLLPRLVTESDGSENTDLCLQCLNAAFIRRREYSTVRIAAFIKQLCTVALHAPPHTSAPLLSFVRQLTQRYSSVHQMLENEQDVITSGQYNPDVEDPEHSNPFATSTWELANLKFHVHPTVAHHASGAASQKMLQLPTEAPERVRAEMLRDSNELYIRTRLAHKKHPLAGRNGSKRQQERFIKARKTAQWHLK